MLLIVYRKLRNYLQGLLDFSDYKTEIKLQDNTCYNILQLIFKICLIIYQKPN